MFIVVMLQSPWRLSDKYIMRTATLVEHWLCYISFNIASATNYQVLCLTESYLEIAGMHIIVIISL